MSAALSSPRDTAPHPHTLTLGISPCPNDVFLFSGLLLGHVRAEGLRFETVFEDVETLNGAAQRGELDVVKISYANYVRIEDDYELLPCGGALGRGVGPLLLVNGGAGAFDPAREVLVPGENTTANFLLDFYLARREVPKRFATFDAVYDELCNRPGAQGVVIHEKRFTYGADGLTLVRDLGEHWENETGHPIPLGAIAVRRGLGIAEAAADAIRRSLDWAHSHEAEALGLCRIHARDFTDAVMRAHIGLYVNRYSRDLGADGSEAVEFFLARLKEFRGVLKGTTST
jgi:1,4-dihydroxy-6-naphthoate synthase